jgi:hypothetical protein
MIGSNATDRVNEPPATGRPLEMAKLQSELWSRDDDDDDDESIGGSA